jgi:glycosyltransferase involved in cell wall biosynthesis
MRIGFDARTVPLRGGIGTYSRNMLQQFADAGLEVVVFCEDQAKNTIPLADSFTIVSAHADPSAPAGRKAFRALVRESGVDLLHVPSPFAPTPCSVPLVATIHDIGPFLYPTALPTRMRIRYKRQFRRTVREASRIITVSRITYSALGIYAGVDQAKARVIHNGVSERFKPVKDAKVLAAARSRHSLPERYAFWVGDFRPEKNLIFLIQAWARLRERVKDVPVLVLAGRKRGDFRKVHDEVRKHGLEKVVMFSGFIPDDDLPAVYSAASVFVFPSLYEGFGLPPLEAMACGTPCVVSNSSSLPEVTGSAALLFNPTSREGFSECMSKVLTESELSESMRQAGLRQAALFSWKQAAEETLQVYREAIADPGNVAVLGTASGPGSVSR